MPLYNMSCPKCGRQTTEYDEGKWTCLFCGNKTILKDDVPDNHYTSFNIHSKALFDLDVKNSEPFQIQEEKIITGYKEEKNLKSNKELVCILIIFVCAYLSSFLFLVLTGVKWSNPEEGVFMCACLVTVVVYFSCLKIINGKITEVKKPIYAGLITANSYCPYCLNIFGHYEHDEDLFQAYNLGLTHCHKCGKQFVIDKGRTYRIK
jgi:DNA-directed RNA polymerase subunit RPC12/RpoP